MSTSVSTSVSTTRDGIPSLCVRLTVFLMPAVYRCRGAPGRRVRHGKSCPMHDCSSGGVRRLKGLIASVHTCSHLVSAHRTSCLPLDIGHGPVRAVSALLACRTVRSNTCRCSSQALICPAPQAAGNVLGCKGRSKLAGESILITRTLLYCLSTL